MSIVELHFAGSTDDLSLSGVAAIGKYVFIAPDEGSEVVRLHRSTSTTYDQPESFPLGAHLDMPGEPGAEADLEGIAIASSDMWVVGSHSAVRKRVHKNTEPALVAEELSKVSRPISRCLLARIPLTGSGNPGSGPPSLAARDGNRVAARLPAEGPGSLHALLASDVHLAPLIDNPGKDNGLDIEGIAVTAAGVLLGLRGPVLRGWAVVLEINPVPSRHVHNQLELAPLSDSEPVLYRKHFLDLSGLGIRDIADDGDDLLLLAGPTMLLDGPSRIHRLPGGASRQIPIAMHSGELPKVGSDLNTDDGHPEAILVVDGHPRHLLILYDSPAKSRTHGSSVTGDLLDI